MQLAEGVDEATWEHHREAGEYSARFRDVIHDSGRAEAAARIESDQALDAPASRKGIVDAVRQRYTAPARGG
ncbi:MAG: hypothetical protein ABI920_13945 [Casimicrobiaceae bacterium]